MARSYSGATGNYPFTLGVIMALLGFFITLRAYKLPTKKVRELLPEPRRFAVAALLACAYVALVVPLGFYTASGLLMLLLPFALGFRRPIYLAVMAAVFIALVFIVFTIVLKKPLPAELWSISRMGSN